MQVQALTRYARMSTKKLRDVARTIQGLPAPRAVEQLTFVPRKSARLIEKTLKSAMANAENNHGLSARDLVVHRALIEQGSPLRRFKAGPRGSGMSFKKRNSHIRIVLAAAEEAPADDAGAAPADTAAAS